MELSRKAEEHPHPPSSKRRKGVFSGDKEQPTFGTQQFKHLREAIEKNAIFSGQGKSGKPVKNICEFFKSKIEDATKKKDPDKTTFNYLYKHQINTSEETIAKEIKLLLDTHKPCCCFENHHQLKIASSTMKVTPSDEANGKIRGLIQVQTYNIVELLNLANNDDSKLLSLIDERINDSSVKQVGAHLCKKVCIRHTVSLPSLVNTHNHECCPAFWIINGLLMNFCHCTPNVRCLAPGQYFKADLFKDRLNQFVNQFVNKTN